VSRIFLSHSSVDNAQAIALRDWLLAEGWNDLFLDLDPERGVAPGDRWERALNEAASRCEAVLFLVSRAWLASRWCMNELNLARRLNKRLFGVLIEEISIKDVPGDVTKVWQVVQLAVGSDHKQFSVTLPITGEQTYITFSMEGLARLKAGLQRAGLHASFFSWRPEHDLKRPPYRGLRPLEGDDAGIFFGREAPVIKAFDLLRGLRRAIKIDDAVVEALLTDIEAGSAKDALPLLAFTLERLYGEYGATGHLKLEHYEKLGRIEGSIEAGVERAFKAADADPKVPKDLQARWALLRRGLIPWLAGIDPDTGAPRRRVARLSEIPAETRPLVDLLIEQRLLSTDVATGTKETTIEPAHEALLRQWALLQSWLKEDAALLTVLDSIKRAARDWAANGKTTSWLAHTGDRLRAAERLLARPDLAANLEPTDKDYVACCERAEHAARALARRRVLLGAGATVALAVLGYGGWFAYTRARLLPIFWDVKMSVLTAQVELALKPLSAPFKECVSCPQMVFVQGGSFIMGSDESSEEKPPPHSVMIRQSFAIGKFEVTFDEWYACVAHGGCDHKANDSGWGWGQQPVTDVSWDDAKQYVGWIAKLTGKPYRLLTEAEWEYAERANSTTTYSWGNDIGRGKANCNGCGSHWDNKQTAPVGSFEPNAFGVHDMHGNVWELVDDCWHSSYVGAPADGEEWATSCPDSRCVVRGGSAFNGPRDLRASIRTGVATDIRSGDRGFRLARTLNH
jgi:formylglycine-generating enzyme required for sulfatase activity